MDAKRQTRHHSLRQLARRPVTIVVNGSVTIEATEEGGRLVVRVQHPEDAVIERAKAIAFTQAAAEVCGMPRPPE